MTSQPIYTLSVELLALVFRRRDNGEHKQPCGLGFLFLGLS